MYQELFIVKFLFFALFVSMTLPVQADHESAERILEQVKQYASRTYTFKPAKKVRDLPSSQTTISSRHKSALEIQGKEVFSVLLFEGEVLASESYANGATADTPVNIYSAAKSFTALAVGEAFCAGKIKSLDDAALIYAPSLEGTAYGAASIRHLLGYTSGAKDPGGTGFSGIHSPADFTAMMRHEISLLDLLKKHGEHSQFKQGEKFIYNGLDSEALSMVVRGATGMALPAWFENTVWQLAGGEHTGAWFTDKDGNGVAEALVWFTSRDFLRIGLYTLERLTGKSNDACMNTFLQEAAQPRTYKGDYWRYPAPSWGLGMHIGADKSVWFMGHGGQRLALNPKTGRILVMNSFREWKGMEADVVRLFSW
uniref:Beta-lactamase-related domain-containing protein n=1 Tax=Curvibacter symbiont subsp. Hydra magnipapillata TaxID=667019 RepID=C9Y6P8_CURXX|nr:hypothetical protein Csp_E36250 [Curvibacter putative symbiont of Hydra magnipapillata]